MFSEGDKVVYPLYGAAVIEGLEQKIVDGNESSYYVLSMPIGNLKIMVSVKNASKLGIREVLPPDKIISIIDSIKEKPIQMADNWNQRYNENMEKIKTGNLTEVSEVFRNLRVREREKGLSSVEKKMLSTARQIILSEIILSWNVEKVKAEKILEDTAI